MTMFSAAMLIFAATYATMAVMAFRQRRKPFAIGCTIGTLVAIGLAANAAT